MFIEVQNHLGGILRKGNPSWKANQIQGPPQWCGRILENNQSHWILTLQGGNPPIHQWCGQIPGNIQSPWILTPQGGNPPMIPIPQWSSEVPESNQSF